MDQAQHEELCDLLLGPLHGHFAAAGQAYGDYLANGKAFRFACELRRTNGSARELLRTHGHLLPDDMQPHANALLHHFEVWMRLWDELVAAEKPAMEQAFAFENPVRFPRDAKEALEQLYARLRG